MEPRIKRARASVACAQIELAAEKMRDDVREACRNLEGLGYGNVGDTIDAVVYRVTDVAKRVRVAANLEASFASSKPDNAS